MSSLYKYLRKEHARLMVEEGLIRIGTLYEYRNIEKYGTNIGDENEGKLVEWSYDKKPKPASRGNRLEKMVIKAGPGMLLLNNYVELFHDSPDTYLYCVSNTFGISIMNKMNKDCRTKYNACVRIRKPELFIREVKKAFKGKGGYVGAYPCKHMSRYQHFTANSPNAALIKEPRYEYQREIRVIFNPVSKEPLSSQNITVEEIKGLCELYYVDNKSDKPMTEQ